MVKCANRQNAEQMRANASRFQHLLARIPVVEKATGPPVGTKARTAEKSAFLANFHSINCTKSEHKGTFPSELPSAFPDHIYFARIKLELISPCA